MKSCMSRSQIWTIPKISLSDDGSSKSNGLSKSMLRYLSDSSGGNFAVVNSINLSINARISMRDRSKNRKPLQKGRSLSIEAIQAVQALKRAKPSTDLLEQAFRTSFRRLLKHDMVAVLRELLRQNQCHLALKVFEDIRMEYWYKPQISLYAELVSVLGNNGLLEDVELLFVKLKEESYLKPDIDGFNALLESLTNFNLNGLAVECYYLMRSLGCDPDKVSFKLLISSLESNGEVSQSAILRQEAMKYYGQSLNFEDEKADTTMNSY